MSGPLACSLELCSVFLYGMSGGLVESAQLTRVHLCEDVGEYAIYRYDKCSQCTPSLMRKSETIAIFSLGDFCTTKSYNKRPAVTTGTHTWLLVGARLSGFTRMPGRPASVQSAYSTGSS